MDLVLIGVLSEVWTSVDRLLTTSMTRLFQDIQYRWQRHIDIGDDDLVDLETLQVNTVVHYAEVLRQAVTSIESRIIRRIYRKRIQETRLFRDALRVVKDYDSKIC